MLVFLNQIIKAMEFFVTNRVLTSIEIKFYEIISDPKLENKIENNNQSRLPEENSEKLLKSMIIQVDNLLNLSQAKYINSNDKRYSDYKEILKNLLKSKDLMIGREKEVCFTCFFNTNGNEKYKQNQEELTTLFID